MAITKQHIVDDIILRLTKGAPSDDLELSPRQVAYWFDITAGEIIPKYLASKLKKRESIDSILIEIDDDLEPQVDDVSMYTSYEDRVYIETTLQILDLPGDRGVLRVITDGGQAANAVAIENLDTLKSMTFSKPSEDNLLYSKVGQKLYIHGLSPKHVGIVQFSVTYLPKIRIADLEDTDEVKITDELFGLIADAVEEKGIRQLRGIADVDNDAEDDSTLR